ncbi:MAG: PadR family transcriptional regulator [Hyphomicrobiales bacterium]|nr:MAG: PadR family transcriptional regulator [Hyphomicrobiales bacterium]
MTNGPSGLTELEGAVLSEIHHRHHDTAFQVRRAFQTSPSIEWSGSAGAVYPAIRRMADAGLIKTAPITTGRKGVRLTLSADGIAALVAWMCDPVRAASVGVDPFRLRAGLWATLDSESRADTLRRLQHSVDAELERLIASLPGLDAIEQARTEWSIELQQLRRRWLNRQLGESVA